MTHESRPRAWVEVDVDAIAHNLSVARRQAGGAMLMPVVKANAYGHGLETVARRLDNEGLTYFGVANVGEARRLEQAGVTTCPFILGAALPEECEEIVQRGWGCTVSSVAEAQLYDRLARLAGRKVSVHLALDTGMGREGFLPEQADEIRQSVLTLPGLQVEGIMSHFPSADDDESYTRGQIELFRACVSDLRAGMSEHPLRYIHIAASAGELAYAVPEANLVRPGLMLYGVSPVQSPVAQELRTTLRLCSRITLVRELPAGHGISYGRSFITARPTRVATIGIGYGDGWSRRISGKGGYVVIHDSRCPILGRVTMDQIMADVSDLPQAVVGDEVELIGERLPVQQVAAWADTIPWEIFTGLGVRLPRMQK